MLDTSTLGLFIVASIAILAVPGPIAIYIVTRGIGQGRTVALVSVAGIQAAEIVYIAAAALGVTAILASSPAVFAVVNYAGAAYLLGLGVRSFLYREPVGAMVASDHRLWRVFLHGTGMNIFNPHTALFYLAFLPPFIDPARASVTAQVVMLGLIFITIGIVIEGGYAMLAGSLGTRLRNSALFLRHRHRTTGAIYVVLGIGIAISGSM